MSRCQKKDEFQTFFEVIQNESTRHIHVIMLTGIRDKVGIGFSADEMQEFMEIRPDGYLENPIEPGRLKEAVRKILKM